MVIFFNGSNLGEDLLAARKNTSGIYSTLYRNTQNGYLIRVNPYQTTLEADNRAVYSVGASYSQNNVPQSGYLGNNDYNGNQQCGYDCMYNYHHRQLANQGKQIWRQNLTYNPFTIWHQGRYALSQSNHSRSETYLQCSAYHFTIPQGKIVKDAIMIFELGGYFSNGGGTFSTYIMYLRPDEYEANWVQNFYIKDSLPNDLTQPGYDFWTGFTEMFNVGITDIQRELGFNAMIDFNNTRYPLWDNGSIPLIVSGVHTPTQGDNVGIGTRLSDTTIQTMNNLRSFWIFSLIDGVCNSINDYTPWCLYDQNSRWMSYATGKIFLKLNLQVS